MIDLTKPIRGKSTGDTYAVVYHDDLGALLQRHERRNWWRMEAIETCLENIPEPPKVRRVWVHIPLGAPSGSMHLFECPPPWVAYIEAEPVYAAIRALSAAEGPSVLEAAEALAALLPEESK